MKTEETLTIYQEDNPRTWTEIERFSRVWNEQHSSKMENVMNIHFTIGFEKDTAEHKAFLEWLHDPSRKEKIHYETHDLLTYEAADLEKADLLHLLGQRAPDGSIVNEETAFGAPMRCGTCGYEDPWSVPQLQPLVIDPSRLAAAGEEGSFFNLANGGLLLSKRAVDVLRESNVKGISFEGVMDTDGKRTDAYFQVLAEKVILFPDKRRTELEGTICPECGTVHGRIRSALFFSAGDIGGLDAFSMHPNHYAMIFFRKEMVDRWERAGVRGFLLDMPAYIIVV